MTHSKRNSLQTLCTFLAISCSCSPSLLNAQELYQNQRSSISSEYFSGPDRFTHSGTKPKRVNPQLVPSKIPRTVIISEIIVHTGETIDGSNPIVSIGAGPSINNFGQISFTALETLQSNRRLLLFSNGSYLKNYFAATQLPGILTQVNDVDHIAFWVQFHIDPNLNTFVLRLDTQNSGPTIAMGNPWPSSNTPFNYVTPFISIANNDRVLFSGDLRTGGTVLASRTSGSDAFQMSVPLSGFPNFYPMIADNNRAIVRGGASETAPIVLFLDETLNSATAIGLANYPDFLRMGDKPGLSDDGRISVFMAEHSTEGAGIYVTTVDPGPSAVQFRLTGLPGSTVNLNRRVAVNHSGTASTDDYTIVYLSNDAAGVFELTATRINVSDPINPVDYPPQVIARAGETFPGLDGNILNLSIYDPVNDNGQVVFWVETDNQAQAIVQADISAEVAFIDDNLDYSLEQASESDNYFLRQDGDYQEIDIFYKILPTDLSVDTVKINIYGELEETPLVVLDGERIGNDYKTGDNLHVVWNSVQNNDEFRPYGFYRLELEVLPTGETESIKTSIEDADLDLPGWQCPQEGLGIHDLVFKHRPAIYVGTGEVVTQNGPVHPFAPELRDHLRLQENYPTRSRESRSGNAVNYSTFGTFPQQSELDDTNPVLGTSPAAPEGTLYIDIRDSKRRVPEINDSYLFHRSHNSPIDANRFIFVHYWMYHPSSYWIYALGAPFNLFLHEGDWEMVQLCLERTPSGSPTDKSQWLLPFAATSAQHYYGQTLAWRLNENGEGSTVRQQRYVPTKDNDQRVKVYIAQNAHACYFREGDIKAPKGTKGCGIQIQYEEALLLSTLDRISSPTEIENYDLVGLEDRAEAGIFDWPGKWGQLRTGIFGVAPSGPNIRKAKIENPIGENSFAINSDPVLFHNLCRKLVDSDGNFDPEGSPDWLTDLGSAAPVAKIRVHESRQIKRTGSDISWLQTATEGMLARGTDVEVDNFDNVIITGNFLHDLQLDNTILPGADFFRTFLAKYSSEGQLQWATSTSGNDMYSKAIAVAGDGNIYVTGVFYDTVSIGQISFESAGFGDVFLAKYDAGGNFQWATSGGGAGDDHGEAIAVDASGNVYLTGSFYQDASFDTDQLTGVGDDIFLLKYDPNGNLIWTLSAGGSGNDYGFAINITANENLIVAGSFEGASTFADTTLSSAGGNDIFLTTFSSDSQLLNALGIGGSGDDHGSGIAVDNSNNIILSGAFSETVTLTDTVITAVGGTDMFIAQFDANYGLQWVQSAGSESDENGYAVTVDNRGQAAMIGSFTADLTVVDTNIVPTRTGDPDVIIIIYDQSGQVYDIVQAGGPYEDNGIGIAYDDNNSLLATGSFVDEAVFGDSLQQTNTSFSDFFLIKFEGDVITNIANRSLPGSNVDDYILTPVAPNPFNNQATFQLQLVTTQDVAIRVFDILGRLVAVMHKGKLTSGEKHAFRLDASQWSSGIYILDVKGKLFRTRKRFSLVK